MKRLLFLMFATLSISTIAYAQSDEYIVKFNCEPPTEITQKLTKSELKDNIYLTENPEMLDGYDDIIDYIEPNERALPIDSVISPFPMQKATLAQESTNPDFSYYNLINMKFPHTFMTFGNNVNVAVIDSGCSNHLCLSGNIAGGYNYITNEETFDDDKNHGTFVSSIIAGEANRTEFLGIAPKVNIYALKCFSEDFSPDSILLAKAVTDAVDKYNCKVINMSFVISTPNQTLHNAIKHAVNDKGAIVVASVGNNYDDTVFYPAGYEEVIGVGSVERNGLRSAFSQYNDTVYVTAPGGSVYGFIGENSLAYGDGTSFAAPFVSGAAAIMLSADSTMTPDEFKFLLKNTAYDINEDGWDRELGHGILDVKAMFNELIKDIPYYLSPVNTDGIYILNNSQYPLSAIGILIYQDDCGNFSAESSDIALGIGESTTVEAFDTQSQNFYLWDSLASLKPLAIHRSETNIK